MNILYLIYACVSPLIFIAVGYLIANKVLKYKSSGQLYLTNDGCYVSLTDEDAEKLLSCDYATFEVKRDNFNGFSD